MSRIYWDTNLFIYLIEESGVRYQQVTALLARIWERDDRLFTSTLTLGEVLVKPVETGNFALAGSYERLLSEHVVLLPFSADTARAYAAIRHDRAIRTPDAIQLACAAAVGMDLFITNDDRLSRTVVPGIHFLAALDQAFI